jgi:serine/threonine protein kinase
MSVVTEYPVCSLHFLFIMQIDGQIKLSPENVQDIRQQIKAQLDILHANGVYHCDLHPMNIMLTEDGSFQISNFEHAVYSQNLKDLPVMPVPQLSSDDRDYMMPELLAALKSGSTEANLSPKDCDLFALEEICKRAAAANGSSETPKQAQRLSNDQMQTIRKEVIATLFNRIVEEEGALTQAATSFFISWAQDEPKLAMEAFPIKKMIAASENNSYTQQTQARLLHLLGMIHFSAVRETADMQEIRESAHLVNLAQQKKVESVSEREEINKNFQRISARLAELTRFAQVQEQQSTQPVLEISKLILEWESDTKHRSSLTDFTKFWNRLKASLELRFGVEDFLPIAGPEPNEKTPKYTWWGMNGQRLYHSFRLRSTKTLREQNKHWAAPEFDCLISLLAILVDREKGADFAPIVAVNLSDNYNGNLDFEFFWEAGIATLGSLHSPSIQLNPGTWQSLSDSAAKACKSLSDIGMYHGNLSVDSFVITATGQVLLADFRACVNEAFLASVSTQPLPKGKKVLWSKSDCEEKRKKQLAEIDAFFSGKRNSKFTVAALQPDQINSIVYVRLKTVLEKTLAGFGGKQPTVLANRPSSVTEACCQMLSNLFAYTPKDLANQVLLTA